MPRRISGITSPPEEEMNVAEKPKELWNRTREFFEEVRREMKNVSWPSRDEVLGTTVVVIFATFVFGFFLHAADIVFFMVIEGIYKAFGL
jgi:preprotein translocase subunit SecE